VVEHRAGNDIGSVDAIQGFSEGVFYMLWAMKDPDYVVKMMATGGSLMMDDSCHTASCRWIKGVQKTQEFTSFDNHFHYCHTVNDHNNLQHSLPSWEDAWVTQGWDSSGCVWSMLT
jgi:hypothetical protein